MSERISGSSKAYLAKLKNKLQELNAPEDGWRCVDVFDIQDAKSDGILFQCETCGCASVRFVHVMAHPKYSGFLHVGCICAGVLEGDILNAKKREKLMKNRAKRRSRFAERPGKAITNPSGELCGVTFKYKGKKIGILRMISKNNKPDMYAYSIDDDLCYEEMYDTFEQACYKVFDVVDPVKEIIRVYGG